MEILSALEKAIQYEIEVEKCYREAAATIENPAGRKVLEFLANEEGYHVEFLLQQKEMLLANETISADNLKTFLPAPEKIRKKANKLPPQLKTKPVATELELLRKALEFERKTSDFYHRMASQFKGKDGEFFQHFCAIEDGHLNLVQAEIDALTGTGIWFDMIEFNLEGE